MYTLKLKEYRKLRGFKKQEDFAEVIGMKPRRYGAIERGETALTLEEACTLAEYLGCSPNDLCGWYDDHPEDVHFSDGDQALVNRCFQVLNKRGRELASSVVVSISCDDTNKKQFYIDHPNAPLRGTRKVNFFNLENPEENASKESSSDSN